MEGGLGLMGGGGGGGGGGVSSGGSANGSSSTVTKAEVVEQDHNMGLSSEVSSYTTDPAEAELELGLGLSLGGGSVKANNINSNNKSFGWGERGARILTAKDLVSASFSSSSSSSTDRAKGPLSSVPTSGTKRSADSVVQEMGSSNVSSQVVGWPPIRAYRINSLVNQAKVPNPGDGDKSGNGKYDMKKNENIRSKNKADNAIGTGNRRGGNSLFVKVNMDGMPIGRKVDLTAHSCYETLAQMLEDMFNGPSTVINPICSREKDFGIEGKKTSKLLDGSSDFVLTYEDKDGDWMLVGDVPWGLFLDNVKRLRIMKTSEANGLAVRFEDTNERQQKRPI